MPQERDKTFHHWIELSSGAVLHVAITILESLAPTQSVYVWRDGRA